MIRDIEGRPKDELDGLLDDLNNLNDRDRDGFVALMTILTGNSRARVAERALDFLCRFQSESESISSTLDQLGLYCLAMGPGVRIMSVRDGGGNDRVFELTVPDSGYYSIAAESFNEDGDLLLSVSSEPGEFVGQDDDSGSLLNPLLHLELSKSEVYYVEVRDLLGRASGFVLSVQVQTAGSGPV